MAKPNFVAYFFGLTSCDRVPGSSVVYNNVPGVVGNNVDIPAMKPLTQASTSILRSLFFNWFILICLSSKFMFSALLTWAAVMFVSYGLAIRASCIRPPAPANG
jgi:hypothetical protein